MGRGASADQGRTVARRRSAGPIDYGEIESAGDPQLEDAVRSWLGCEPSDVTFTKAWMPVEVLRGNFTEEAGLFLSDGDQDGYDAVIRLARAFERGEEIPPIVIAPEGDGYAVLDGCHRLSGAWHAGAGEVAVYVTDRPVAL